MAPGFTGLGHELRAVDFEYNNAVFNRAGLFQITNAIAVGTGPGTRTGRKVIPKSFHLRGWVKAPRVEDARQDLLSIIVVVDKQGNGNTPVKGDVLHATSDPSSTSFNNLNNMNRFLVLARKQLVVGDRAAFDSGANPNSWEPAVYSVDINVRNLERKMDPVMYKGNGGAVNDIAEGAIWVFLIGQHTTAAHDYTLTYETRFRYTT